MINSYETREAGRNPECSSASSHRADVRPVPALHGLLCVPMCQGRCPPIVGSESGSQSDARLSFLRAGGRVHTASAAGARVQGESSGLIVLKEEKHTLLRPELL